MKSAEYPAALKNVEQDLLQPLNKTPNATREFEAILFFFFLRVIKVDINEKRSAVRVIKADYRKKRCRHDAS